MCTEKRYKPKECRLCGTVFEPKAPCNLYCGEQCSEVRRQEVQAEGVDRWRKRTCKNYGVGKGGSNKRGRENSQYKTGKGFLAANRQSFKESVRYCESCGKDLLDAEGKNSYCIHHRDHNPGNNPEDFSNWQLLCSRCHHVEHEKHLHLPQYQESK